MGQAGQIAKVGSYVARSRRWQVFLLSTLHHYSHCYYPVAERSSNHEEEINRKLLATVLLFWVLGYAIKAGANTLLPADYGRH